MARPMRFRDSNLLNMMDTHITRKMQEHLSIPVEGELTDINAENFLNDDIFEEFVNKSKDVPKEELDIFPFLDTMRALNVKE